MDARALMAASSLANSEFLIPLRFGIANHGMGKLGKPVAAFPIGLTIHEHGSPIEVASSAHKLFLSGVLQI
jgi:hypothetical protein